MPERDAADILRHRPLAVVGKGRLGPALVAALRTARVDVAGPLGRGEPAPAGAVVLLCVPDGEIEAASRAVGGAAFVGHTSGATGLDAIAADEAFSLHPLQTVTAEGGEFAGCACAVDGSTPAAREVARALADALSMTPIEVEDRAAYHAAASIASNFLVTLLDCAEEVAEMAGVARGDARAALAPLVETTVRNWVSLGPRRALTGPIVRGDEATVAAQRAALPPDVVAVFDALAERTRALVPA